MTRCVRLSFALMLVCAAPLSGQESRPAPRVQFTLDAGAIGGSLGVAWRIDEQRMVGVGGGVGGDIVGYMLLAGRHFAEDFGLSYERKDGYHSKFLLEYVHLNAFMRQETAGRWEFDAGLRASTFLHYDSSDDDPGGGLFMGGYAAAYYSYRAVKLGPRVLVGAFKERRAEFGIFVVPLTLRFAFGI